MYNQGIMYSVFVCVMFWYLCEWFEGLGINLIPLQHSRRHIIKLFSPLSLSLSTSIAVMGVSPLIYHTILIPVS